MRSQSVVARGKQTPTVRHAPARTRRNAWEDVSDVAKAYGLVLDEWQENVLEAAMGERTDGQWSTPRVGITVPRQNGKGALLEARELAGLLVFGELSIVHSAHEQRTARIGFDRLKAYFDNYDDLRRKVKAIGAAVGREYIELRSGQFIRFPARSKGAIRGFSIDCLLLDEAQVFSDLALQAVMPTMAARPNPQMWLLGTPPTPADDGDVFTRWREAGHARSDRRLCWCEWSALPGVNLDDREVWAAVNPALGDRISYEAVADERAALDDEGFGRERLGMWTGVAGAEVIDATTWKALAVPVSDMEGDIAVGIDVAPDRSKASMGTAGFTAEGRLLVDHIQGRNSADWVVAAAEKLMELHAPRCFVIDLASQAATFIQPLVDKGIPVATTNSREFGQACGQFYDSAMSGLLAHLDQPSLNVSLAAARKRDIGSEGLWGWSRRDVVSDITPIVSVTLAVRGLRADVKNPPRKPAEMYAF